MNIGKIIKDIRKKQKVKQITLAKKCNITQTYLSQIENNQKEPNISILRCIAQTLNMPLPILFFLSIDNDDISPEKLEAFKMLAPSIKSLITAFFDGEENPTNQYS